MTLSLGAALAACPGNGEPPTTTADAGVDIQEVTPLEAIQPNGCGGVAALVVEGQPVRPGEPCGACDGVVTCSGPDTAVCTGATAANACGGCGALAADVGATCGHCGGTWQCGPDGALACSDDREPNVCGGCVDLGVASPGAICETEGQPGVTRCIGLDAIQCIPLAANGCGGTETLDGVPGTFCGACDRGVFVCNGTDTVVCQGADTGVNACGGCGALQGAPGATCAGCDGTWACDTDNASVTCQNTPFNACGGCEVLDGVPGETCDDGVWACSGVDAVACVPDGGNLCGGSVVLADAPGTACGACGDGVFVCATTNTTVCAGASGLNACGGCGFLPGVEGDACAPNGVWACHDGAMVCDYDPQANPCGGSGDLDNAPGTPCGTCDSGVWACNGFEAVACSGGEAAPFHAWPDVDGDSYGDRDAEPVIQCELEEGFVRNADDCDDTLETGADVQPGAIEVCDGIDNDCDDVVDPGSAVGASVFYADKDGDGIGAEAGVVTACEEPAGHVTTAGDCNDNDVEVYPGAPGEACDDPKDYDCDGVTLYEDADEDGFPSCGGTIDCDDSNATVKPGAAEFFNGIDDDCDGATDEDSAIDVQTFYADLDGDSFGDPNTTVEACTAPSGYVANADDCDDTPGSGAAVNPNAVETCDGIDNNCNGQVDLDTPIEDKPTWHQDIDGDGFGSLGDTATTCNAPPGYVPASSAFADDGVDRFDCAPADPSVHPNVAGAPPVLERCDFMDNDCDGHVDMGAWTPGVGWPAWPGPPAADGFDWVADRDGDGFANTAEVLVGCHPALPSAAPSHGDLGFAYLPAPDQEHDCNDANPNVYPEAFEVPGDGVDQSCDGTEVCFVDADNDGAVGDFSLTTAISGLDCEDNSLLNVAGADAPWDCDDADAGVRPGVPEIIGDEKDQNCDGIEMCFRDADGDGFRDANGTAYIFSADLDCGDRVLGEASAAMPQVDCDDADPTIHPTAADRPWNPGDTNCDGFEGAAFRTIFVTAAANGGTTDPGCGSVGAKCSDLQMAVDKAVACPSVVDSFITACQAMCYPGNATLEPPVPSDAQCLADCVARGNEGARCDVLIDGGGAVPVELAETLVLPGGLEFLGYNGAIVQLEAGSPSTLTIDVPDLDAPLWLQGFEIRGPTLGTMKADGFRAPNSVALRTGENGTSLHLKTMTLVGGKGADAATPANRATVGQCPQTCPTMAGGRANYDLLEAPFAPAAGTGSALFSAGGAGGGNSIALLFGGGSLDLGSGTSVVLGAGGTGGTGGSSVCPATGNTQCIPSCCDANGANPSSGLGGAGGAGGSVLGIALTKGNKRPFVQGFDYTDVTDHSGATPGAGGSGRCFNGFCSPDGEAGLVFPMYRSTTLLREHQGFAIRDEFIVSPTSASFNGLGTAWNVAKTMCNAAGATLGSNQWPDSPSFLHFGLNSKDYWVDWVHHPDTQQPETEGQAFATPVLWGSLGDNPPAIPFQEDCITVSPSGMEDRDCESGYGFVCEWPRQNCVNNNGCWAGWQCAELDSDFDGSPSDCNAASSVCGCVPPDTPDYYSSGFRVSDDPGFTRQYALVGPGTPWTTAVGVCPTFVGGSSLARLETQDEAEGLAAAMEKTIWTAWIGANDRQNEGQLVWADGAAVGDVLDTVWVDGQPDNLNYKACGFMNSGPPAGGTTAILGSGTIIGGNWGCNGNTTAGPHALCREPMVDCPFGHRGFTCELCSEGFAKDANGVCRNTCANSPCIFGTCSSCLDRGDCDTAPTLGCNCPSGREGPHCEWCADGTADWNGDGVCDTDCATLDVCGPDPAACIEGNGYVWCINTCPLDRQDHDRDGVCDCLEGYTGANCDTCAPGFVDSGSCSLAVNTQPTHYFDFNEVSGPWATNRGFGTTLGSLQGFPNLGYPDADPLTGWTADSAIGPGALRFNGQHGVNWSGDSFGQRMRTIEALVKLAPSGLGAEQIVLVRGSTEFGVRANGQLFAKFGPDIIEQTAGSPLTPGQWHHIAYKHHSVTGYIYVDGVNVGSGPAPDPNNYFGLRIGLDYVDQRGFVGVIDAVRLFHNDTPSGDADIQTLYNAAVAAMGN